MVVDISLCKEIFEKDDYGNEKTAFLSRSLVAELLNVSRNEFFKARQDRLNAEFVVKIHWLDYQDEKIVEHNGKLYNVYRTYFDEENDIMELYLTERIEP